MWRLREIILITIGLKLLTSTTWAQLPEGRLSGSIQVDAQYYFTDSLIGARKMPEKMRANAFATLQYQLGNFTAGTRYEMYQPAPLLGFDERFSGQGIPIRFFAYHTPKIQLTLGHFYEQFGSGMLLRSYWEPMLGLDNAIDGVRLGLNPVSGLQIKGIYGHQRSFFGQSPGLLRGADAEFNLTEALDTLWKSRTKVSIGGGIVNRYQSGQDPVYILPENVSIFGGRMTVNRGRFSLFAEGAYKINDPAYVNQRTYRAGHALWLNGSYSGDKLGITASLRRLDNIDFRSNRDATFFDATVNFLPPIARQHTYRLPSLYIYATQLDGEMGSQLDVSYYFDKGSFWGGQYGASLTLNYARVHNILRQDSSAFNYESPFFAIGKRLFYQDLNIEYSRKFSTKVKATFMYANIIYDRAKILNLPGSPVVYVQAVVADVTVKLTPKRSIRTEAQWMGTQQDFGSWVMLLTEYAVTPHWFFTLSNEYNYGNPDTKKRVHYPALTVGYIYDATRITIGYGRQRQGIVCIGGLCRPIPAINGFTLTISHTF